MFPGKPGSQAGLAVHLWIGNNLCKKFEHFSVIKEWKTSRSRSSLGFWLLCFHYWRLLKSAGCSLFTSHTLIKLLGLRQSHSLPPASSWDTAAVRVRERSASMAELRENKLLCSHAQSGAPLQRNLQTVNKQNFSWTKCMDFYKVWLHSIYVIIRSFWNAKAYRCSSTQSFDLTDVGNKSYANLRNANSEL